MIRRAADPRVIKVADLPQKVRHGGMGRHSAEIVAVFDVDGHQWLGQFIGAKASHADYRKVFVTLKDTRGVHTQIPVKAHDFARVLDNYWQAV